MEWTIAIRFAGRELKPEIATEILGLNATRTKSRGQEDEKHPGKVFGTGSWIQRHSGESEQELSGTIQKILKDLEGLEEKIKQIHSKFDCESSIRIGVFLISEQEFDINLSPEMLSAASRIALPIEIRLYSSS